MSDEKALTGSPGEPGNHDICKNVLLLVRGLCV